MGFPTPAVRAGTMVLFSSFGHIDAPTPHGGPAFSGWKNGHGFGKAAGPGCHVMSPDMPMQLRYTPKEDRCFSATPFWRTKYEVGQAASFGFGDRPKYGKGEKDGSVAPNNYGDISKQVPKTRNVVNRSGITLHPRYPSIEEKYRDLSWPQCGPGPGKYDTRIPTGQGSWTNPVGAPAFSMQSRPILDGEIRAGMGRPAPSDYETRIKCGTNSPIRKGTLYDIKCKGRLQYGDHPGNLSPGPARYNHKAGFDSKGLLEKIKNVPIPKESKRQIMSQGFKPTRRKGVDAEGDMEEEAEDYEGRKPGELGRPGKESGDGQRKLPRVESAPGHL